MCVGLHSMLAFINGLENKNVNFQIGALINIHTRNTTTNFDTQINPSLLTLLQHKTSGGQVNAQFWRCATHSDWLCEAAVTKEK